MDLQSGLVYGPVRSRRLGTSLGVNLAPPGRKTCNFNCAYCQYGWTDFPVRGAFPAAADVIDAVDRGARARIRTSTPSPSPATASRRCIRASRRSPRGCSRCGRGARPTRSSRCCPTVRRWTASTSKYSLSRFDTRCMKLDAGDATTFRRDQRADASRSARLIADLRQSDV